MAIWEVEVVLAGEFCLLGATSWKPRPGLKALAVCWSSMEARGYDEEANGKYYQDLPCTLNWGYMVPNRGYLGPNRG